MALSFPRLPDADVKRTAEIPQLVTELFEMTKRYLEQEAVTPLRHTGRRIGLSLLAAVLFAIGWLLLGIAALRLVQDLLPDGNLWSVLAYVVGAAIALGVGVLIIMRAAAGPKEAS